MSGHGIQSAPPPYYTTLILIIGRWLCSCGKVMRDSLTNQRAVDVAGYFLRRFFIGMNLIGETLGTPHKWGIQINERDTHFPRHASNKRLHFS